MSIIYGQLVVLAAVVFRAIPAIIRKPKELIWAMILPAFICSFAFFNDRNNIDIAAIGFAFLFIFTFSLVFFYKEDLVSIINERAIFLSTIVLWYVMLNNDRLFSILLIPALIFSLGILTAILIKKKTHLIFKCLFYAGYMGIMLSIALTDLTFGGLDIIFRESFVPADIPGLFLGGLFFMFIMVNAIPILILIPGKRTSTRTLRENWQFVSTRVTDEQFEARDLLHALLVIAILGSNLYLDFISFSNLSEMMIMIIPLLYSGKVGKIFNASYQSQCN
jgi:hypothetical protein